MLWAEQILAANLRKRRSEKTSSSPTFYKHHALTMKRKLDEHDVPVESQPTFDNFGLDPRLLQAVRAEKYTTPTVWPPPTRN